MLNFLFFDFCFFWPPSLWDGVAMFRADLAHTTDAISSTLMLTLKRVLSSPSRWFSADQASSPGRPSLPGLPSPLCETPFPVPWMGVRALSRD